MVVPYIGTWIETDNSLNDGIEIYVVPYIGTWIETVFDLLLLHLVVVVPYIGTWIETSIKQRNRVSAQGRTLYRYVD